jgi:hypothetical protein
MSVRAIPSFVQDEHPRTRIGLLTATLASLGWLVALRIALVSVLDDPVHPVTYIGVVGGVLGAAAVQAIVRWTDLGSLPATQFWATYLGDGDPGEYVRQGTYLHVLYGAVAGGCYPRLFWLLGFAGEDFAALPWSLAIGLAFGLLAFVVALVFLALGVVEMDVTGERVAAFLSLHLVYGLVVGAVVGLYAPVLADLL